MAQENVTTIIDHIQRMYPTMSRVNRRIADYLLREDTDISSMTIGDFARATEASSATVVRFCRLVGYKGFAELKVRMADSQLALGAELTRIGLRDSVGTIRQKVIALNKRTMDDLAQSLGDDLLERVALLLRDAERIVILSDGGSSTAGYCAYDAFTKLSLDCVHHTDPFFQLMAVRNLDPGRRNVVFAINNSGRSVNTIESLKLAREMGIPTVGVVGLPSTPAARWLDYQLVTGMFESDIYSDMTVSRVGEIGVVSVLYAVIAARSSRTQIRKSREIIASLARKRV